MHSGAAHSGAAGAVHRGVAVHSSAGLNRPVERQGPIELRVRVRIRGPIEIERGPIEIERGTIDDASCGRHGGGAEEGAVVSK